MTAARRTNSPNSSTTRESEDDRTGPFPVKRQFWLEHLDGLALTKAEVSVANTLATFMDTDGYCSPGTLTTANRAHLPVGETRAAIKGLEEAGLVITLKRQRTQRTTMMIHSSLPAHLFEP